MRQIQKKNNENVNRRLGKSHWYIHVFLWRFKAWRSLHCKYLENNMYHNFLLFKIHIEKLIKKEKDTYSQSQTQITNRNKKRTSLRVVREGVVVFTFFLYRPENPSSILTRQLGVVRNHLDHSRHRTSISCCLSNSCSCCCCV